ncbi:MAG: response regulator [Proteobacteria bacterium]|nr:response regulator [Pseudomonadota bacterium]
MSFQQESILIVDDDVDVLAALEAELQDHYDVTAVTSVEQALAHLQCRAFAAIVSDVRMPGVDGLSLITQCAVRYPNMVRIILTAFDGEDVHETALGPYGAFKLVKPWGDDLLITLQNALKQRQSNLELKRHLDLKSELLDLDRRLHTALDLDELARQAAQEMMRIPEVTTAAVYMFEVDGTSVTHHVIKTTEEDEIPELRQARSTPVAFQGQYLYSVPIGEWSNPWAAVALRLSSAESNTIRYLDFIGRQAYRTLLLIRNLPGKSVVTGFPPREYQRMSDNVSAAWMLKELTTPATVITSANRGFERLIQRLKSSISKDDGLTSTIDELVELNGDLSSIGRSLTTLLGRLKKIDEDAEEDGE